MQIEPQLGVNDAGNSWTLPITADANDFISTDSTAAKGKRKADGSLPDTDFLKLKADSDLIDAGTEVGLGFEGAAPDLGANEFSPKIRPQPPQLMNPVAQYSFSNSSGNVVTDSATAGSDNSGILDGGGRAKDAVRGRHIVLSGNSSAVKIPNSRDINLGIQPERTISMWFKIDDKAIETRKQVLYEEGAGVRGLNAYVYDDKLYVGGWNEPTNQSGWEGTWLKTDAITNNTWHHVAIVLNGSKDIAQNAITGYLDGQAFGSGAGSQLWGHGGGIGIGNVNGGTQFHDNSRRSSHNQGLAGALDDVAIFNDALSSEQVQSLASL